MTTKTQDEFALMAHLMRERERLSKELADIEIKLVELHRSKGLPYTPAGGKRDPKIAALKTKQHEAGRLEARKRGISYGELRDEKTAKGLGVPGFTGEHLRQMRAEHKIEAVKAGLTMAEWRAQAAEKERCGLKEIERVIAAKFIKRK